MVVTFKLLGRLDTIALAETAGNAPCKMVCLTNVESSPLLGPLHARPSGQSSRNSRRKLV